MKVGCKRGTCRDSLGTEGGQEGYNTVMNDIKKTEKRVRGILVFSASEQRILIDMLTTQLEIFLLIEHDGRNDDENRSDAMMAKR